MKYTVGNEVRAATRIYETQPDGRQTLIAKPGELGVVLYVGRNGAPLVKFAGGAIDCNDSELEVSHAW